MCLDWLLASTEYTEFVYMMLEFKVTLVVILIECRMQRSGMREVTMTNKMNNSLDLKIFEYLTVN
jgi:hypothetical protein